jgi:hypothetical protein
MAHKHWKGEHPVYGEAPTCHFGTKKDCDNAFADWQAAQQVRLAARIVEEGRAQTYRRDETVFGQLVQCVAGTRQTITNDEGNPSQTPFTKRIVAMLETYRREHPAHTQEVNHAG